MPVLNKHGSALHERGWGKGTLNPFPCKIKVVVQEEASA